MKATTESKPGDAALTRELLEIGLEMQDSFSAEPTYAKTGKGFLKSAGVEEDQSSWDERNSLEVE